MNRDHKNMLRNLLNTRKTGSVSGSRVLRMENLESRELLSASTLGDLAVLSAATSGSALVATNAADAPIDLSNADLDTIVVTSTADSGEGSLRDAVKNAPDGATITFDAALAGETINLATDIAIPAGKTITVDASSLDGVLKVDATGSRVFTVAKNANLTVTSLNLTGGGDNVNGGVISSTNATVVLNNVDVKGATAKFGGAIYASKGSITVNGGSISDSAAKSGGAIYASGASVTIDGTSFSENTASSTGGSIYSASKTALTINGATFSGDSAAVSGASIYAATGATAIANSAFNGATGAKTGGALFVSGGTLDVDHVNFANNVASTYGGAIYALKADVNVSVGAFSHNVAATRGGAIYVQNAATNKLAVNSSEFAENTANAGGAVALASGTTGTFESDAFVANIGATGSALYVSQASFTLTNATVAGNKGVALYSYRGTGVVNNSIIVLNDQDVVLSKTATSAGSLEANYTLSTYTAWTSGANNPEYNPEDPLFVDAEAGDYSLSEDAGVAINQGNNDYVAVDFDAIGHARISKETVDLGAYEVTFEEEIPSLVVTTWNDSVNPYDGKISLREAIAYQKADPTLGDTITFAPELAGKTISITKPLVVENAITIDSTNSAQGVIVDGAGKVYHVIETTAAITIDGLTITGGLANGEADSDKIGAGIYAHDVAVGTVAVKNSVVTGNKAIEDGAAIYVANSALDLANTTVSDNEAKVGGGVVANNATVTANNVVFSGNKAEDGAAVALENSGFTSSVVEFSGNAATGKGGAIYAPKTEGSSATINLVNVVVAENSAEQGGAFYLDEGARFTLNNGTVTANTTTSEDSAAIQIVAADSQYDLVFNSIVARNTGLDVVVGQGGAVNVHGILVGEASSENVNGENIVVDNTEKPLFELGGYALTEDSQAVDKGLNSFVTATEDYLGNPRPYDGGEEGYVATVDLGAFEFQGRPLEAGSNVVTIANDKSDSHDGETSLREAIEYVTKHNEENPDNPITVEFADDLDGAAITLDDEIEIKSDITINGGDSNITITTSDDADTRLFTVEDEATLTITDLTLSGGSDDNGGAIKVEGANLVLSHVVLTGNTATAKGGVVYAVSTLETHQVGHTGPGGNMIWEEVTTGAIASVTVDNSLVYGNKADEGSAFYFDEGTTWKIYSVTIADNASESNGAALVSNKATGDIANTIVVNNGLDAVLTDSTVTAAAVLTTVDVFGDATISYDLTKPLFTDADGKDYTLALDSQAIDLGVNGKSVSETDLAGNGRIYENRYGVALIDLGAYESEYSIREDASIVVTTADDVVDAYDGKTSLREAIAALAADPTLGNAVTFADDYDIALTDGAVSITTPIKIEAGDKNVTISSENSGVFTVDGENAGLTLDGVDLTGGVADKGALVAVNGGSLTIVDATLTGGKAEQGGAVYVNGGSALIVNSVFSGNTATAGSAIYAEGDQTATAINVTIANNAGSAVVAAAGTVKLQNSIVALNTADENAGGYALEGATLDADYTLVADLVATPRAEGAEEAVIYQYDETQPLFALDGYALVDYSQAIDRGLNAYIDGYTTDKAGNARIFNNKTVDLGAFESEFAVREKKDIVVTILADKVDEYDNEISLREAIAYQKELGGDIVFKEGLNGVITLSDAEDFGTLVIDSAVKISAKTNGNQITVSGDGKLRVFEITGADAVVTIEGVNIADGYTESTRYTNLNGALVSIADGANVTIDGSTLSGGKSENNGGAISVVNSTLAVTGSTITGNTAESRAAGIYASGSTVKLADSFITKNEAIGSNGGAIFVTKGTLDAVNVVVANNRTEASGGAFYVSESTATITNATIVKNYAGENGGGLWVASGSANLYNTIITGNDSVNLNWDAGRSGDNVVLGGYNVIWYDANWSTKVADIEFDLETDARPLFADAANGDYTLVENSVAFNAGNNDYVLGIENDITGTVARIIDTTVDIGAYEANFVPETPSIVVTTDRDDVNPYDGLISLREALAYQKADPTLGDTITFAEDVEGATLTLDPTRGELTVDGQTVAIKSNSGVTITVAANASQRILNLSNGAEVALDGISLAGGTAANGALALVDNATLSVKGGSLTGGNATGNGGAIAAVNGANVSLAYAKVSGNTAANGGAISLEGNSTLSGDTLLLVENNAAHGAALYATGSNTIYTINSSTITANTATADGGATIETVRSSMESILNNSIIAANNGVDMEITNSMKGFIGGDGNLTTHKIWGLDNLTYDSEKALFVDAASSDYHLAAGSQAADIGDNSLAGSTDFDGNERISGGRIDAGAYEYQATPETTGAVLDEAFAELFAEDLDIEL